MTRLFLQQRSIDIRDGALTIPAVEDRWLWLLVFLIAYLVLCGGAGWLAQARGRSGLGWSILAFILTPLLAVIILLCLGNITSPKRQREMLEALRAVPNSTSRRRIRNPRNIRPRF